MTKTINIAITVPADVNVEVSNAAPAPTLSPAAAWPYPTEPNVYPVPIKDRLHAALINFLGSNPRYTMRSHLAVATDVARAVPDARNDDIADALEAALDGGHIEEVTLRNNVPGYRIVNRHFGSSEI